MLRSLASKMKSEPLVYEVVEYFEVTTEYNYPLGLREGDKIQKIGEGRHNLIGTGHVFTVLENSIEPIGIKEL